MTAYGRKKKQKRKSVGPARRQKRDKVVSSSSSEGTLFSANSKSDDVGKETSGGGVNDGTVDTSGLRFLDAVSAGLDQIFASTNLLSQEKPHSYRWLVSALVLLFLVGGYMPALAEDSLRDSAWKGMIAALIFATVYTVLHTRDGLYLRPPTFWRAVHGSCLWYLFILSILAVLPPDHGRRAVNFMLDSPSFSFSSCSPHFFVGSCVSWTPFFSPRPCLCASSSCRFMLPFACAVLHV